MEILFSILVFFSLFWLGESADSSTFGPNTNYNVEQHHSLKPPLDKSQVYWSFGGATVLTQNLIRLTPSTQDRRGWLWNEYPLESASFEVEITFEVYSKPHFGGDGMAIWFVKSPDDSSFTQQPDALIGPIFGMKNDFQGVGVLLDVYDNDGKRNNPSIFVVSNKGGGVTSYNHDNDFENDMVKTTKDNDSSINHRCVADFRNNGKPSKILIVWLHNILHVYVNTDSISYKFCLAVSMPDIDLKNYHIAFTSATGQVADNMDILEVSTRYLSANEKDMNDRNGASLSSGTSGFSSSLSGLSGPFWSLVNLLGLGSLAAAIWTLHTLRTQLAARLDAVFICARINPVIIPHYSTHAALTFLLLLGGFWIPFGINLVFVIWRGYSYSKSNLLLSAPMLVATKGHSTSGSLSIHAILYLTITVYSLMQLYYLYKWFW